MADNLSAMSTNSLTPFNRRKFIRAAALAAAGTALGMPTLAANPAAPPSVPARPRPLRFSSDLRDGLKPRRVTNAMWDYSWLTQHYPGGAFADFDRAADELVERGFNTGRIDAFPLVIGALHSDNETITIPGDPLANWGMSDRDREHTVVRGTRRVHARDETARALVILSSWGKDCQEHPNRTTVLARNRDGFRKCWERTLDLLGSQDVLDVVLYVDLDQEFPYFSPFQDELNKLGESPAPPRRSRREREAPASSSKA